MDMKKMMKQAQKMQRDAAAAQQEIAAMTFEASAGGGMVKATATGEMAISLSPMAGRMVEPKESGWNTFLIHSQLWKVG